MGNGGGHGSAVLLLVLLSLLLLSLGHETVWGQEPERSREQELEQELERGSEQEEVSVERAYQWMLKDVSDGEMDRFLEETLSQEVTFQELVVGLLKGEEKLDGGYVLSLFRSAFLREIAQNGRYLVHLCGIWLMSAAFSGLSRLVENGGASRMGNYVLLTLAGLVVFRGYQVTGEIAVSFVKQVTDFMRVLLPLFFVVVVAARGATSALAFHEFLMLAVYVVETIILKLILPLCGVYVVLRLVNQILGEDRFSKMGELIRGIVLGSVKWLFVLMMGLNAIQGIITPAADQFRRSTLHRTISSIPGVGNLVGGAADVVTGSAILIKNGVGAAALLLIVLIVATPLIQLYACFLSYKLTAALMQPLGSSEMVHLVETGADGAFLLIKCTFGVAALLFLTLAMVTIASG